MLISVCEDPSRFLTQILRNRFLTFSNSDLFWESTLPKFLVSKKWREARVSSDITVTNQECHFSLKFDHAQAVKLTQLHTVVKSFPRTAYSVYDFGLNCAIDNADFRAGRSICGESQLKGRGFQVQSELTLSIAYSRGKIQSSFHWGNV